MPAGALPSCRQLLDLAQEAQHIAAERMREPAGVLRVTTASSFAEAQLTSALLDFQAQYEQVEIVLSVGDKAADLVSERVDLAVRITNNLDPAVIARPLARCRSVLCASPSYLARFATPRTAEDLSQHRCIGHAFGIGKQYSFTRNGEMVQVPVNWRFHTNETAVLRRAVLSGAGIGMLPTYYVGDDLRSGRLLPLLPDHEPRGNGYLRHLSLASASSIGLALAGGLSGGALCGGDGAVGSGLRRDRARAGAEGPWSSQSCFALADLGSQRQVEPLPSFGIG